MIPTATDAVPGDPVGSVSLVALVRSGLEGASAALREVGVPVPSLGGKLLRPMVAYAMVPPALRSALDQRFWLGVLAVEMAHEASLVHDDIIDGAGERRGVPTVAARWGVAQALVLGDHYLTGAYRAAAASESPSFLAAFIEAVERTVAGEVAQEKAVGHFLDHESSEAILRGKSGELFGAAASLGGAVFGLGRHDERVALGRELGALYQQVDDLLDYCPAAGTGKPALIDYWQRKWTWVLGLSAIRSFDLDEEAVLAHLFGNAPGEPSPARVALDRLRARGEAVLRRVEELSPGDTLVAQVVAGWMRAAEAAVGAQEGRPNRLESRATVPASQEVPQAEAEAVALAQALGGPERWPEYFGHHARTFSLASRLFPAERAALVTGVYAYCRFTDDLVDDLSDGVPPERRKARLEAWSQLTRSAFEGCPTGVPLLDTVLGESGRRGVSWRYPDALLAGVEMDLSRTSYRDWTKLEEYTFGVAGAVGGWITQLFGLHEEHLLDKAHALGHGMQLTNIARDVGEDLAMGRVYLPEVLLQAHGLSVPALEEVARGGGPLPPAYVRMMEELMARADAYYDRAWPGIRALPAWYRRPVAVAAQAYQGIHGEIRRNGHDTLRRRAATGLPTKLLLGALGVVRSRALRLSRRL